MLVAKTVALDLYRALAPVVVKLGTKDSKLAKDVQKTRRQIVDAVTEGSGRFRGDRAYFFECAYGSCEELEGKLAMAELDGTLGGEEVAAIRRLLDREKGLLWGLARPRRMT